MESFQFFGRDYTNGIGGAYKAAVDLSNERNAGTIYIIRSPLGNITGFELRIYQIR